MTKKVPTIEKGLHGINRKIPLLNMETDLMAFGLQLFSLFVCIFSVLMWCVCGFDSTLDGWINLMEQKYPIDMGDGTHWSTLLNYFAIVFLISTYLSKKKVKAFHNMIVSTFTAIVAVMAFEFPWLLLNDVFHNNVAGNHWAVLGYGLGTINVPYLIFGAVLIPISTAYVSIQASYNKLHFSDTTSNKIFWVSWLGSLFGVVSFSLWFGTPSILIRNTFAVFFIVFIHAVLTDALKNPHYSFDKYQYRFRIDWKALLMFVSAVLVFLFWIFYPFDFTAVKGTLFPQTVYGVYNSGELVKTFWVQNDGVHFLNVLSKFLVTALVSYVLIPKIAVKKDQFALKTMGE